MIKMDNFQYFSIKSPHRGDSNSHPKHDFMENLIEDNLVKNTGLL